MTQQYPSWGHRSSLLCIMLILGQPVSATASNTGCHGDAKRALDQAATYGIQRGLHIVHDTHKRPAALFDLSCLDQYVNGLNELSILFDPGQLFKNFLDQVKNQVCDHAERLWAHKKRPFDKAQMHRLFNGIPGVRVDTLPYNSSHSPVQTQLNTTLPDIELILPKVLGQDIPRGQGLRP